MHMIIKQAVMFSVLGVWPGCEMVALWESAQPESERRWVQRTTSNLKLSLMIQTPWETLWKTRQNMLVNDLTVCLKISCSVHGRLHECADPLQCHVSVKPFSKWQSWIWLDVMQNCCVFIYCNLNTLSHSFFPSWISYCYIRDLKCQEVVLP